MKQTVWLFQLSLVATIAATFILTFLATKTPYFPFDLTISLFVQNIDLAGFRELMEIISQLGNYLFGNLLTFLATALIFLKGKKLAAYLLFISAIGAQILTIFLKELVSRQRPDPALISQTADFLTNGSFPSGHVLFYVGFYGFGLFLIFTLLPRGILRNALMFTTLMLIFLSGLSRIYLGAHWFSDVLGAYLIGFLWLNLVILIYRKLS